MDNYLLIPKDRQTSTGSNKPPDGWEAQKTENLEEKDRIAMIQSTLNTSINAQVEIKKKVDEAIENYKKESHQQISRSIEIIGVFSAILALIIVNTDLIKSLAFLPAILLMGAMTASLVIFASLIHFFFNPDEKRKLSNAFWIAIFILMLFIVTASVLYFFGININFSNQNQSQNMESVTSLQV